MVVEPKRSGSLVLRLIVGLALLGWPRVGSAQGTWSVISLPRQPGEVVAPTALAVDTAGNLYVVVAEGNPDERIEKRDAQGNWSVIATQGSALGQVNFYSGGALAVDAAGNLYVAELSIYGDRIQKRDAQGNWTVLATEGTALGEITGPNGLAVDGAGNLYVADAGNNRVLKYTPAP